MCLIFFIFFFNDTATTEIYTLSLHDALPISHSLGGLLTREYCEQFNSECHDRIRRFITIATPHFGSELADILLVYRDDRDHFSNPFPYVCKVIVNAFVNGFKILGRNLKPHPIGPVGGAIDDLATGQLPDLVQSTTTSGRWKNYPSIQNDFSAHSITGTLYEPFSGNSLQISVLWDFVLFPCGFTIQNVFGNDFNDRIVRKFSQQGGLMDNMTTDIGFTDHFTVRNASRTINRIKLMLDEPAGSIYFTK